MFYKSVAFYLNKYTQPEHQLFTMLPISAMTLREMTAAYIENNPCELVEFKELIDSDPHYCQKIRENEVWKEETEMLAIAYALKTKIQVYLWYQNKINFYCVGEFEEFEDSNAPTVCVGFRPIAKCYDSIIHLQN